MTIYIKLHFEKITYKLFSKTKYGYYLKIKIIGVNLRNFYSNI